MPSSEREGTYLHALNTEVAGECSSLEVLRGSWWVHNRECKCRTWIAWSNRLSLGQWVSGRGMRARKWAQCWGRTHLFLLYLEEVFMSKQDRQALVIFSLPSEAQGKRGDLLIGIQEFRKRDSELFNSGRTHVFASVSGFGVCCV